LPTRSSIIVIKRMRDEQIEHRAAGKDNRLLGGG
jgi:hypothetical protein